MELKSVIAAVAVWVGMLLLARLVNRLTATRISDGTVLYLAASVGGSGDGLQQTAAALDRVRRDSGLPMELVFIDRGLTVEGRRIAEIEARRRGFALCRGEDIFT